MEMGKAIRKVFVPKNGFVFLDADYSQIELRILAHMSGDEKLIEAYNSSADIHRATHRSLAYRSMRLLMNREEMPRQLISALSME